MKKLIVIILALSIVGLGVYFTYQKIFPAKEYSLEDYMPSHSSLFIVSNSEEGAETSLVTQTKPYQILKLIREKHKVNKTVIALTLSGDVTIGFEGIDNSDLEDSWEEETDFGMLFFSVKPNGILIVSTTKQNAVQEVMEGERTFLEYFGHQSQYVVANIDSSNILRQILPFLSVDINSNWTGVIKAGLKVEGEDLYLDGLAQVSTGDYSFLSALKKQGRLEFLMDKVMSDKTALVHFFSLNDGLRFKDDLLQYFYANQLSVSEEWEALKKDYGIDVEELFYSVEGQAGLAQIFIEGKESKLFYLPILNEEELLNWLGDASNKIGASEEGKDSLYRGVRIGDCPINDFSSVLLGKEFSVGNLEKPSYLILDGYCVFGDLYALRQLVIDYEEDEVWGRSIDMKGSVQSHVSPCHLGVVCNPHFLSQLVGEKEWVFGVDDFAKKLEAQKVIVLEYTWDGNECFVDFSISGTYEEWHNDIEKELLVQEKDVDLTLDTIVLTKPLLVNNKQTKQKEILLLDAKNNVMLISQEGQIRWSKELEGVLVGDVKEVDLFRNGKVQYLIGTSEKIYCLDRLGRDVQGFPWVLPKNEMISGYSVIDYERNKKYRVLVSGVSGDLYLYDKSHKNLKGWTPVKTSGSFSTTPTHLRVRGKDYIVGQHKDGSIEVRRRSAAVIPHFPYKTGVEAESKMYVEKTSNFETTCFTSLLKDNSVRRVNLYGEIVSKKQFAKDAKVNVVDVVGGGLAYTEQKGGVISFYNQKFVKLFDRAESNLVSIQIYHLKGKQFYFVRSLSDGRLTILDGEGLEIDVETVFSSSDVALLYFAKTKTYKLFFVEGNKMKTKSLKLD